MLWYDVMQNESTDSRTTQFCYQEQLNFMTLSALDYFAKCWCWAMAGDTGGYARSFLACISHMRFYGPRQLSWCPICSFASSLSNELLIYEPEMTQRESWNYYLLNLLWRGISPIVNNSETPIRKQHFVWRHKCSNFQSGHQLWVQWTSGLRV